MPNGDRRGFSIKLCRLMGSIEGLLSLQVCLEPCRILDIPIVQDTEPSTGFMYFSIMWPICSAAGESFIKNATPHKRRAAATWLVAGRQQETWSQPFMGSRTVATCIANILPHTSQVWLNSNLKWCGSLHVLKLSSCMVVFLPPRCSPIIGTNERKASDQSIYHWYLFYITWCHQECRLQRKMSLWRQGLRKICVIWTPWLWVICERGPKSGHLWYGLIC